MKLVLQPLVENAIYHGIKYKEGRGLIQIRVFCQDDCIVLQVEDDGKGMDEETLAHIFEQHIRDTRSNGVGVNNVNERIRLFYGAEYGLSFKSEPEKGTTATIRIPAGKGRGESMIMSKKKTRFCLAAAAGLLLLGGGILYAKKKSDAVRVQNIVLIQKALDDTDFWTSVYQGGRMAARGIQRQPDCEGAGQRAPGGGAESDDSGGHCGKAGCPLSCVPAAARRLCLMRRPLKRRVSG